MYGIILGEDVEEEKLRLSHPNGRVQSIIGMDEGVDDIPFDFLLLNFSLSCILISLLVKMSFMTSNIPNILNFAYTLTDCQQVECEGGELGEAGICGHFTYDYRSNFATLLGTSRKSPTDRPKGNFRTLLRCRYFH